MNLRTGIFLLVVSVACVCATESKSNAQLQRGGQLAARAAVSYASRVVPGIRIARWAQRGARVAGVGPGGGQGFRLGTQQRFGNQFGNQFGVRNGLQAGRFFRRR